MTDVIRETKSIVISIKAITVALEQGFWISSLLNNVLGAVLNPFICSNITDYVANRLLRANPYGSFAGGYADMANSIIKEQQTFFKSRTASFSFKLDTRLLDEHYEPPC